MTAMIITLAMFCGLTVYALFTRTDFSKCVGVIIVIVVCFATFGILCAFSDWNPILYSLYCCLGVILAGVFIVFDTELILGGDRRIQLSLDDYVIGAMILYIDLIRLFLWILRAMGSAANRR